MPQDLPLEYVFVWETDDGPTVTGLFATEDAAFDAAFEEWCALTGGNIGGYQHNTPPDERRAEFDEVYLNTDKLWIVPLGR